METTIALTDMISEDAGTLGVTKGQLSRYVALAGLEKALPGTLDGGKFTPDFLRENYFAVKNAALRTEGGYEILGKYQQMIEDNELRLLEEF